MGNTCEHIRPLLLELEYGELEAGDSAAVEAHLEACATCRERLAAFQAVRADLNLLQVPEPAPARVTFVAVQSPAPIPQRRMSVWTRGLAAAASFVFGLLLVAAFFNTQISRDESGWSLSASLWNRPAAGGNVAAPAQQPASLPLSQPSSQPPATGPSRGNGPVTPVGTNPRVGIPVGQDDSVRFMSQSELETWIDDHFQSRFVADTPARPVSTLHPEEVQPILEQLMKERDAQWQGLVKNMLAASEVRQREELSNMLVGVYEVFDAQRSNDLLFLAGELGLLQENTGLELQRTNAAIDYLITRAAQQRPQEERDEQ